MTLGKGGGRVIRIIQGVGVMVLCAGWVKVIMLLLLFAGKILFGRSQIHQVAEKRRGKIEEYSQVGYLDNNVSSVNEVWPHRWCGCHFN